jgi:hypothetical protein
MNYGETLMKSIRSLLALLAMSLLVTACGGSSSSNTSAEPEKPITTPDLAPEPPEDLHAVISIQSPAQDRMIVKDPITIKLDASNSKDDAGSVLTYRWSLVEKPDGSLARLTSDNTVATKFTADIAGKYVTSLIVNNGEADSASSRMTFTAISPKPIAVTDPKINVALGTSSVELDGSGSQLPETATGQLQYNWLLKTKPKDSLAALSNAKSSKPNLSLDLAGEYRAELIYF